MLNRTSFAVFALSLWGCASIESTPTSTPGDGLVYYMPKKDVKVTVVRATSTTTVTISATAAYADLNQQYVLNFSKNWIGTNDLKVGVNESGLLTSTKAVTTPKIGEALQSAAGIAGSLSFKNADDGAVTPDCPDGTFDYLLRVKENTDKKLKCNLHVRICPIGESKLGAANSVDKSNSVDKAPKPMNAGVTGIFYRQVQPYLVTVSETKTSDCADSEATTHVKAQTIILSPSESPVRFLPIERTLFAPSTADFAFSDGVPTKYDQNTDGELIALLKLPAVVIQAYFAAIGAMFSSFQSTRTNEISDLQSKINLDLAKIKYEACVQAIKDKDDALIAKLECGK